MAAAAVVAGGGLAVKLATSHGSGSGQGSGDCRWCSYYAGFSNGLPSSRGFFPIAIWDQYGASSTSSGAWGFNRHYPNLASAAVGMGINTFVGESGWPAAYGADSDPSGSGFLQSVCNAGGYAIAGGDPGAIVWRGSGRAQAVTVGQGANNTAGTFTLTVDGHTTSGIAYDATAATIESAINKTVGAGTVTAVAGGPLPSPVRLTFAAAPGGRSVDYSGITDTASIASVRAAAAHEKSSVTGKSCLRSLAGYTFGDEPSQCAVNVPADVAAMHAIDPTRMAYEGMASWVAGGFSGCPATANANFAGSDIPASDDYHDTDAYSAGTCAAAHHVRTSPWADCSWLYGYQAAVQARLAGPKPTWVDFETGNDVFHYSELNSSSCVTSANICRVKGEPPHEYNATAPQVNANVWGGLINGAAGIIWFCDGAAGAGTTDNRDSGGAPDSNQFAYSDCLGGGGNPYSSAEFSNLQYINRTINTYAPELNTVSGGACTMQPSTYATIDRPLATHCTNGNLAISTSSAAEPIQGMTKHYNGHEYLFVMADRANGRTTGTYTVRGYPGHTATLVYDSAARYDPSVSEQGRKFTLNSSSRFTDSLVGDDGQGSNGYGAGANSYQVKIYRIQ
jgi:hypothetical protein